ncbi:MAG: hypothetical protein OH319_00210 [Candidatus Parvarchaeota archaeon]|nr:hypothetical protein [Candidatus Jingweiarchaeum tengchongense]MCW1298433.1 hypothetical protein [Candidatus Jingweiarchaeum tengchongense]MCW1300525.1 hypothetical protein [Candidatus Jingweiarchaeum tengchongense]MCW1310843.1 hypothetical protein [Candidatus Jingweiarchaeum tengchongense]
MKIILMSSRLNKKILEIILLFLIFLLVLIIPSNIVFKQSKIDVKFTCVAIEIKEKSCSFECSIIPIYEKDEIVNTRILILHSGWSAIYDKTFRFISNKNNTIVLELPKRNYSYSMMISLYTDEDIGASKNQLILFC